MNPKGQQTKRHKSVNISESSIMLRSHDKHVVFTTDKCFTLTASYLICCIYRAKHLQDILLA